MPSETSHGHLPQHLVQPVHRLDRWSSTRCCAWTTAGDPAWVALSRATSLGQSAGRGRDLCKGWSTVMHSGHTGPTVSAAPVQLAHHPPLKKNNCQINTHTSADRQRSGGAYARGGAPCCNLQVKLFSEQSDWGMIEVEITMSTGVNTHLPQGRGLNYNTYRQVIFFFFFFEWQINICLTAVQKDALPFFHWIYFFERRLANQLYTTL